MKLADLDFPPKLLATDFDKTTHDTFETAPALGIYGIDEVYRSAVDEVFCHDKEAMRKYTEQNEHSNRTPAEIVHSISGDLDPANLDKLTDQLIEVKLRTLSQQIGRKLLDGAIWPRPLPGFEDCWQKVTKSKTTPKTINTAIISAGHTVFIRKTFEVHGLEQPDILVSEETIRGLNSDLPPDRLAKPNVLPLSIAIVQWLNIHKVLEKVDPSDIILKPRILYVGDDESKDRAMALKAGVDFVLIDKSHPTQGWPLAEKKLGLV